MFGLFKTPPGELLLRRIWPSSDDLEIIVGARTSAAGNDAYPRAALEASTAIANLSLTVALFLTFNPNPQAEATIRAAERLIFERLDRQPETYPAYTVLLLQDEQELWVAGTTCPVQTKSTLSTILRYVLAKRMTEYQKDYRQGLINEAHAPLPMGPAQTAFFEKRYLSHVSGIAITDENKPNQEGLSDAFVLMYFNMLSASLMQNSRTLGLSR